MREIWCDINGYGGLYQVSNLGNVFSLPRQVRQGKYGKTRLVGGNVLKATDNGNGYLIVGLRDGYIRNIIDKTYPTLEEAVEVRGGILNGEINPTG